VDLIRADPTQDPVRTWSCSSPPAERSKAHNGCRIAIRQPVTRQPLSSTSAATVLIPWLTGRNHQRQYIARLQKRNTTPHWEYGR